MKRRSILIPILHAARIARQKQLTAMQYCHECQGLFGGHLMSCSQAKDYPRAEPPWPPSAPSRHLN